MAKLYNRKIQSDDGNVYYDLPKKITMPVDDKKYVEFVWRKDHSMFRLAYFIYGDGNKLWILLAVNNIKNPYSVTAGTVLRFLLPEFEKEIEVE